MKKYLIVLLILLINLVNAQQILEVEYDLYHTFDAEKVVDYEITINDHKLNKEETIRYLKDEMTRPKPFILLTDKSTSTYDKKPILGDGTHLNIDSKQGNGVYFKNLDEKFYIHESIGFGFDQLIKDSLPDFKWVLTRDSKNVLGFKTRKAIGQLKDNQVIEAWYSVDLPYSNGPSNFQGLPGLILEVVHSLNDNLNTVKTFRAMKVKEMPAKTLIKEPKKGKIVNLETYLKNMEEYVLKMREMEGQGVNVD